MAEALHRVAEAVREACLQTALRAYEEAGVSGLCEEGRWECAIGAIRGLDLDALVRSLAQEQADLPPTRR